MATIQGLAKYLVEKFGEISTMKLQKLCYFTQGWYWAVNDAPLFDSEFQAWRYGPVNRALYDLHAGRRVATSDLFETQDMDLDSYQQNFADSIYLKYREFSGFQLGDISHRHPAWLEARGGLNPALSASVVMDDAVIVEHFKQLLDGGSDL